MRTLTRLVCAAAATATFSSAQAAEPSVETLLPSFSDVTSSFLVGNSLQLGSLGFGTGTQLLFSLVAEQTKWADTQTFSIIDGNSAPTIFAPSASPTATNLYTVVSSFTGVAFNSNSNPFDPTQQSGGSSQAVKVFRSGSTYGFAYEDWNRNGGVDFNDMVVTVSAVPEPGTYALMLAGLGVVAATARRRRKSA